MSDVPSAVPARRSLFAADALLPEGWARRVLLQWDETGRLDPVQVNAQPPAGTPLARGPVIPGLPNLHSHAFQRAFAGLTEHRAEAQDSFWSWRTLMYRFAARLGPQQMEAIATWLYAEMLEAGYTSVCEFQYVHHQPDGRPYADDASLSLALLRAAESTGIGITLLPVLYQSSGFGGLPPNDGQRRFIRSTDSMLKLLEVLKPACGAAARLGLAPHSLRAVPPEALREALAGLDALDATAPIHIHIAEQTAEVEACLAWSGQRPVAWLLDHARVDARWCLVHATHMDAAEYARAAQSGAVAGLCPSTEANLGDGLFDFSAWRGHGGAWGIGSDSHACVNAAEELLLLEYGQRLVTRHRNIAVSESSNSVGETLFGDALFGGAQASGVAVGAIEAADPAMPENGPRADLLVLDDSSPLLAGRDSANLVDTFLFAGNAQLVRDVMVNGAWVVRDFRHRDEERIAARYRETARRLAESL